MEYDVLPLDTADVAVYSDVRMSGVRTLRKEKGR